MQEQVKGRKIELEAVSGGYILTLVEGPLTPHTEREVHTEFIDVVGRLEQVYLEDKEGAKG